MIVHSENANSSCFARCTGKGEFGTVYRAAWHDSVVAVKVLNDDSDVAKGELRYFKPNKMNYCLFVISSPLLKD